MNARKVSWDDVEHFCQHTQFLETLCGPRCPPDDLEMITKKAGIIKSFNRLFSSLDEVTELVMTVIDEMSRFPRERKYTWHVIACDAGDGVVFIRVTIFLK